MDYRFTPTGVYSQSHQRSGTYTVTCWVQGHGTVNLGLVKKVGSLPSMQGWHAYAPDGHAISSVRYRTRQAAADSLRLFHNITRDEAAPAATEPEEQR